ncbi:MAG: hypothetical protein Q4P05_04845 [Actinomycetaceae bacterium]|nr:hypothetical protein [Actinomycetaceae bacterium]
MAKKSPNQTSEALSAQIIRRWGRRKLSPLAAEDRAVIAAINADYVQAASEAARNAHAPDTAWLISQWCSPRDLGRKRGPKLPQLDLVLQAINVIENLYTQKSRTIPRRKIREPLARMWQAHESRRRDKRWNDIRNTKNFTTPEFERWYQNLLAATANLTVIPNLPIPHSFVQASELIELWDQFLRQRGHTGERFSLQEELTRLHNWPGDQWNTGDDYAATQKRYHRRLAKARKKKYDPLRDQVMKRALYLREGLLTDPIDPLGWFLATAAYLSVNPNALLPVDKREYSRVSELLDHIQLFSQRRRGYGFTMPSLTSIESPGSPADIPAEQLRWVSGPHQMIDLDEDVVAALPPGCQVKRLIVSKDHPMGPDWMVYWVESEEGGARPILDLVETAKLRPPILFVSDGHPGELASLIEPQLHHAYTIPTHPLTAYAR